MKLAVAFEEVLSNSDHRKDLRNESFEEYQEAIRGDQLNEKLATLLNEFSGELVIYSMTPENLRPAIVQWLIDNEVDADGLLLKKKSDFRSEQEIKMEMILSLGEECQCVIENGNKLADALREKGYLVFQF